MSEVKHHWLLLIAKAIAPDAKLHDPFAKLRTTMLSNRVHFFTESVIRSTTRHALAHDAINLSQGLPEMDTPEPIKAAAIKAIRDGYNQYAVTWGVKQLREAIAHKSRTFNQLPWVDADKHVTVCCGATECMMATMLATVNEGDEVIVFQPFYENYGPDGLLSGAKLVWVHLEGPDWKIDREKLAAAFGPRTRAIIINTPNNPTGKVFTRDELQFIAELCIKHNTLAITDEIYEHLIYNGTPHVSLASLPGMAERTVTISGLSKTFSMTGWRLGYCIAPESITPGIRRVHDFLTVGAPHPLQLAGAAALALPASYYTELLASYAHKRSILLPALREAGFVFHDPDGAYYVMCDFSRLRPDLDDAAFSKYLIEQIGVAGVAGSSFHSPKELGRQKIRFMWAKQPATLEQAGERLRKIRR
jgi:aspartate/methionine/tyrosine aminotransferase